MFWRRLASTLLLSSWRSVLKFLVILPKKSVLKTMRTTLATLSVSPSFIANHKRLVQKF